MTKKQFMIELAGLLSKIPEEERNDAINYYEDYFADAGIADEMLVPSSVGTPKQVADKIIGAAIYEKRSEQTTNEIKDVPKKREGSGDSSYYSNSSYDKKPYANTTASEKYDIDNTKLVLGVVLIILTFPIWIGIAGALFGILAGLAGMIVGFGIAGISLILVAVLSNSLAGGMIVVGIGCILLALAIVLIIPLVMFCGKFLPWLVKNVVKLFKEMFRKKEYAA